MKRIVILPFLLLAAVAAVRALPSAFGGSGGLSVATANLSNPDVIVVGGNSLLGTLATGSTFYSFTPKNPITLVNVEYQVMVAGIAGSGDSVYCNGPSGVSLGPASTSAAAVALTRSSLAAGSINVAAGSIVSCHIEGSAATKPIVNMALSYQMQ